jgi:transcriptional regulator with XRE-family HTH domain
LILGPRQLDCWRRAWPRRARPWPRRRRRSRATLAPRGRSSIQGHDFKRWRKSLDFSQKEAANALGLKRRVVQYYEKGERDGKEIDIPKSVRLACLAIVQGAEDYHGPDAPAAGKARRKHKAKANNHDKDAKKGKRKAQAPGGKPAKRKAKARAAPAKSEKERGGKEKR